MNTYIKILLVSVLVILGLSIWVFMTRCNTDKFGEDVPDCPNLNSNRNCLAACNKNYKDYEKDYTDWWIQQKDGYKEKKIITMFLTEKHSQEAKNTIISLDRVGMKKNLVVTCLDKGSYEFMGQLGVNRRLVDTGLPKEAGFGTQQFYNIMRQKIDMILYYLKSQSLPILYMDTDVVVLQNLDNDLQGSLSDITFQCDQPTFQNGVCSNNCAGFMFIKSPSSLATCIEVSSDEINVSTDWVSL